MDTLDALLDHRKLWHLINLLGDLSQSSYERGLKECVSACSQEERDRINAACREIIELYAPLIGEQEYIKGLSVHLPQCACGREYIDA